jgi:hypothetical protein
MGGSENCPLHDHFEESIHDILKNTMFGDSPYMNSNKEFSGTTTVYKWWGTT